MHKTILLGGGCFWCTEAVFKMMKGVSSVLPGYAGGETVNPTYEQICGGNTGHAEVVQLIYDPAIVKLEDILTVFFGSHDPTTVNKQGNDIGTQYRSVIFYEDENDKKIIEAYIHSINESSNDGNKVVTEVMLMPIFYEAEEYHKNYFKNHPGNPYCEVVINPKLQKVQEKYADLLNTL